MSEAMLYSIVSSEMEWWHFSAFLFFWELQPVQYGIQPVYIIPPVIPT